MSSENLVFQLHLYYTDQPDEFEESEISSKDDCFVDGDFFLQWIYKE